VRSAAFEAWRNQVREEDDKDVEGSAEEVFLESTPAQNQAARWISRLTSGKPSDVELRAFERWRAQSPENARAADELWSLWLHVDRITPPRGKQRVARRFIRYSAAGLAASLIVGFLTFRFWHDWRFDEVTALGERREIVLSDGTHVELNSDTAISVRFDQGARFVSIARGEAYFDVVHLSRPFVVESGAVHVQDLGTEFAVRRDDAHHIKVSVESGEVQVQEGAMRARLGAGQTALAGFGSTLHTTPLDAVADLAWRRGRLIIIDQTLASAIESLSRYHAGPIFVTSAAADNLRVNAVISLAHIDDWLLALQRAEPVKVTKLGPIVWIR
jgi:transmembrane sensor